MDAIFLFTNCYFYDKIDWENRKMEDEGNDCMISVDGADFRVPESGRKFFSHKYKKSAFSL